MSQPLFDTFKYVTLLTEHHFSEQQVKGLMSAQILTLESTLSRLVTHKDLQQSEFALRADLVETEHRLKTEIAELRSELKAEIAEVEHKLDAKINTTASELKAFVVKNTLATILTMLSLFIGIIALDITKAFS